MPLEMTRFRVYVSQRGDQTYCCRADALPAGIVGTIVSTQPDINWVAVAEFDADDGKIRSDVSSMLTPLDPEGVYRPATLDSLGLELVARHRIVMLNQARA
jgi:hypothetical protein